MAVQREFFSSRLGFILAAAGSSIGLGAIWKFPYMAGSNGGGAFLIVYLAVVVFIGLAMMLAEIALGRATHTDAVGAFGMIGGRRWRFFGYSSLLAAFLILSFYCVVGGWTVAYLIKSITGSLLSPPDGDFSLQFKQFTADPVISVAFFLVFMGMTAGIILGGITNGIERLSKILMPLLFLLMLVMVVRSLTLEGSYRGLVFFLTSYASDGFHWPQTLADLKYYPFNFTLITPTVLIDVLGFACFSLSLGFGGMLTYGSYMQRGESIIRAGVWVIVLQTICCIMAGLMVLPAVFAFGMEPGTGPGLTYITLPAVFSELPGGRLFAIVFFSLFLTAALTSSVSILEPIVTWLIDQVSLSRKAAGLLVAGTSTLLGISACWSFGAVDWTFGLEHLPPILKVTPFEVLDYLTLKVIMPLNVLATCLLMGWIASDVFRHQLFPSGLGKGPNSSVWPRLSWLYTDWATRVVAPLAIIAIVVASFVM